MYVCCIVHVQIVHCLLYCISNYVVHAGINHEKFKLKICLNTHLLIDSAVYPTLWRRFHIRISSRKFDKNINRPSVPLMVDQEELFDVERKNTQQSRDTVPLK